VSSRPAFVLPDAFERLRRYGLGAGIAGLLATLVGWIVSPDQFFRSYLFAFLIWNGVAIGCLSIVMIHHLTGGLWGVVIRRVLEAGTRTFPLTFVLFLPIAVGLPHLYSWARPEVVAADPLIQGKRLYLNVPFFLGRVVFYFAVWAVLAHFLNKWSLATDAGEDLRTSRRLRSLSGGGLVLMGLTITFAAVDWAMSLNPHWFSTIYGVLFMVGTALSALSLAVVVVTLARNQKPFAGVLQRQQLHDLGTLMFAFVMLLAYVSFSQFLIVWSGNLPEEIPWYIQRLQGGWFWIALAIVLLQFAVPFLLLLSRSLKRNPDLLGPVATLILVMRMVDLFWLVAPDSAGHGAGGLHLHWLDFTAPIGVGGLWVAFFAWQLQRRPLLPVGDPEMRELLEGVEA
jgi:hypothetical protein